MKLDHEYPPPALQKAIQKAYDPLHPIIVKLECTECEWKDEFRVEPSKAKPK